MNVIDDIEKSEIDKLGIKVPAFGSGDTLKVSVSVVEGERKRIQVFEGVVISKKNRGLNHE